MTMRLANLAQRTPFQAVRPLLQLCPSPFLSSEVVQNSSRGVPIDALFIDEGFGSLDQETPAEGHAGSGGNQREPPGRSHQPYRGDEGRYPPAAGHQENRQWTQSGQSECVAN